MSAIVADAGGMSYAELRAGELHQLHTIPYEASRTGGAIVRAVRHDRGLIVAASVSGSNVPLLTGSADGSGLRPAPGIPGAPQDPAMLNGVTWDGTALVTLEGRVLTGRPEPMHFLRWGSQEWTPLDVPEGCFHLCVVGSEGDKAYVVGGRGPRMASNVEMRPALFEVDFAKATVTELALPDAGPVLPRRHRLRGWGIDPAAGYLEHGAFNGDVLVANASYGYAFEWEVLHAISLSRGLWSAARLRRDSAVVEQHVAADGTAYAVTSDGDLWISHGAQTWQRTGLRSRMARVLGIPERSTVLQAVAFAGDRLLLATAKAVLSCAADGTAICVLAERGEGSARILHFVRPPVGVQPR